MEVQNISVAVRARPLFSQDEGSSFPWSISSTSLVLSKAPNSIYKDNVFRFATVFGPNDDNASVHARTAAPLISSVLSGINCTLLAYGQTGSGKTHTILGSPSDPGVVPRAWADLFKAIRSTPTRAFTVNATFLELYNEELRDLMDPTGEKLSVQQVRDGTCIIPGLRRFDVDTFEQAQELLAQASNNRFISATKMNQMSSRSHALFTLTVESEALTMDDPQPRLFSSLVVVDLAGSERTAKSGTETGLRRREREAINLSLLSLGMVISQLTEGASTAGRHVNYRNSLLTRLLQVSLGGNAKTSMICTITPSLAQLDESISTLRFASNATKVKNRLRVNVESSDAVKIAHLKQEVEQLKKQGLELQRRLSGSGSEADWMARSASLEQQMDQAALVADLEACRSLVRELQMENVNLQRAAKDKQKLEEELAATQQLVKELRKQNAVLSANLAFEREMQQRLQVLLNESQASLEEPAQYQELMQEIQLLGMELQIITAQRDIKEGKCGTLAFKLLALQEKLSASQAKRNQLTAEVSELREALDNTQTRLQVLVQEAAERTFPAAFPGAFPAAFPAGLEAAGQSPQELASELLSGPYSDKLMSWDAEIVADLTKAVYEREREAAARYREVELRSAEVQTEEAWEEVAKVAQVVPPSPVAPPSWAGVVSEAGVQTDARVGQRKPAAVAPVAAPAAGLPAATAPAAVQRADHAEVAAAPLLVAEPDEAVVVVHEARVDGSGLLPLVVPRPAAAAAGMGTTPTAAATPTRTTRLAAAEAAKQIRQEEEERRAAQPPTAALPAASMVDAVLAAKGVRPRTQQPAAAGAAAAAALVAARPPALDVRPEQDQDATAEEGEQPLDSDDDDAHRSSESSDIPEADLEPGEDLRRLYGAVQDPVSPLPPRAVKAAVSSEQVSAAERLHRVLDETEAQLRQLAQARTARAAAATSNPSSPALPPSYTPTFALSLSDSSGDNRHPSPLIPRAYANALSPTSSASAAAAGGRGGPAVSAAALPAGQVPSPRVGQVPSSMAEFPESGAMSPSSSAASTQEGSSYQTAAGFDPEIVALVKAALSAPSPTRPYSPSPRPQTPTAAVPAVYAAAAAGENPLYAQPLPSRPPAYPPRAVGSTAAGAGEQPAAGGSLPQQPADMGVPAADEDALFSPPPTRKPEGSAGSGSELVYSPGSPDLQVIIFAPDRPPAVAAAAGEAKAATPKPSLFAVELPVAGEPSAAAGGPAAMGNQAGGVDSGVISVAELRAPVPALQLRTGEYEGPEHANILAVSESDSPEAATAARAAAFFQPVAAAAAPPPPPLPTLSPRVAPLAANYPGTPSRAAAAVAAAAAAAAGRLPARQSLSLPTTPAAASASAAAKPTPAAAAAGAAARPTIRVPPTPAGGAVFTTMAALSAPLRASYPPSTPSSITSSLRASFPPPSPGAGPSALRASFPPSTPTTTLRAPHPTPSHPQSIPGGQRAEPSTHPHPVSPLAARFFSTPGSALYPPAPSDDEDEQQQGGATGPRTYPSHATPAPSSTTAATSAGAAGPRTYPSHATPAASSTTAGAAGPTAATLDSPPDSPGSVGSVNVSMATAFFRPAREAAKALALQPDAVPGGSARGSASGSAGAGAPLPDTTAPRPSSPSTPRAAGGLATAAPVGTPPLVLASRSPIMPPRKRPQVLAGRSATAAGPAAAGPAAGPAASGYSGASWVAAAADDNLGAESPGSADLPSAATAFYRPHLTPLAAAAGHAPAGPAAAAAAAAAGRPGRPGHVRSASTSDLPLSQGTSGNAAAAAAATLAPMTPPAGRSSSMLPHTDSFKSSGSSPRSVHLARATTFYKPLSLPVPSIVPSPTPDTYATPAKPAASASTAASATTAASGLTPSGESRPSFTAPSTGSVPPGSMTRFTLSPTAGQYVMAALSEGGAASRPAARTSQPALGRDPSLSQGMAPYYTAPLSPSTPSSATSPALPLGPLYTPDSDSLSNRLLSPPSIITRPHTPFELNFILDSDEHALQVERSIQSDPLLEYPRLLPQQGAQPTRSRWSVAATDSTEMSSLPEDAPLPASTMWLSPEQMQSWEVQALKQSEAMSFLREAAELEIMASMQQGFKDMIQQLSKEVVLYSRAYELCESELAPTDEDSLEEAESRLMEPPVTVGA